MAKITVYLPNELAARVLKHRKKINVSGVAHEAIAEAIDDIESAEPTHRCMHCLDLSSKQGEPFCSLRCRDAHYRRLRELGVTFLGEGRPKYQSWGIFEHKKI